MTLFKYLAPERIDVIERGEIRFTQPGALNDPFEMRPRFDSLIAEAEVLSGLAAAPIDLGLIVEQAHFMLPEDVRERLPLDVALKAAGAAFATEHTRAAAGAGIRMLLQSMRDGAAPARRQIYQALNKNVGLLSLSEAQDHELMWAHYAASHTGFVLGFNEQHPFFNRRRSEHDEFFFLRKVLYADSPSAPFVASLDGDTLMVTKGTRWAYEREWRMILPLAQATSVLNSDSDTLYLFAFPRDAIESIVLGANATSAFETRIRGLLRARPDLGHVHVRRAVLDLNARTISVLPIPAEGE